MTESAPFASNERQAIRSLLSVLIGGVQGLVGVLMLMPLAMGESTTRAQEDPIETLRVELAECRAQELSTVLQEAFAVFMERTRAFDLESSRILAEAMHSRALAGWSAMSLALISTRSGDSLRARDVLEEQIARTPEGPAQYELLERLGLAIQGAGYEARAMGPLGSAFARGSANAGVVLGRIALREGQLGQARAIFRTLLTQDTPQSWAHRGWGLSMLPPDTRSAPRHP